LNDLDYLSVDSACSRSKRSILRLFGEDEVAFGEISEKQKQTKKWKEVH
jgi:hypothetical protein